MISKSLFLADCIENFKRRNWVVWLQFLVFFISFPGALILGINSIQSRYMGNAIVMEERLTNFIRDIFHLNEWISMLIVGLAILAGIQGFSWLHDKKQVNFYHSQPISRNRRFLVIWFGGIVSYLFTYLVNLALGMGVAASYGCLPRESWALLAENVFAHLLLFWSIYHVAIVAVMLTGHTLVSLIGTAVLLFYEVILRILYHIYAQSFFGTYSYKEGDRILHTLFSPLFTFFNYVFGRNRRVYGGIEYSYSETMFTMAGLTLFFGLLGWLLYKNRASESHGKSISFPRIKEPLKVLLLLVIGATGGLFAYELSGDSEILAIAGAIFVTLIGHAVIQLIYEVDFRAIRKNLPGLGVSILLVVLVFAAFRWDIFGYDEKIPKKEKVESMAIVLEDRYFDGKRVLSDGTEVAISDYLDAELKLDVDMVYRLLDNRVNEGDFSGHNGLSRMDVVFRLKNGKTSYRVFYFDEEENLEVINEIFHAEEYQKVSNQVMEEGFVEDFRIFQADYDNGRMNYAVPQTQVRAIAEAYVQDVKNARYSDLYYDIPIGELTLGGQGIQNPEYVNEWRVPIYPTFTSTRSLLKKTGIVEEAVCDQDYLNRIRSISVWYYEELADTGTIAQEGNQEQAVEMVRKRIVFGKEGSGLRMEDYEEDSGFMGISLVKSEKLKEILDKAYLQKLGYLDNYVELGKASTYEIMVELYKGGNQGREGESDGEYKYSETYGNDGYNSGIYYETYNLEADQLPGFVLKAIEEVK